MKIRIDGEMLNAMRAGEDTYIPVVGNEELELENGDWRTTVKNLRRLVDLGRKAIGFYACHRHVLVIFDTGESYLATGFALGHKLDEMVRFAEFAASQGFGTPHYLKQFFSGLDMDYEGPIEIIPPPHTDGQRLVESVPYPALEK